MQPQVRGARGSITSVDEGLEKLSQYCDDKKCEAQIFDASLIFGVEHVLSAYEHARRAFDEDRNSAKTLSTETLLYASGERQISTAIEKMGINDGTKEFCIMVVGDSDINELIQMLGLEKDDRVLDGDKRNLKAFGISKEEMDTLPEDDVFDLVLERVAMVDLLK